jgi:tryptophan halogenase
MKIAVHGDGIAAHLAALMLAGAGQTVVRVPVGNADHGLGPIGAAVVGLPDWHATEIAAAIGWVPGGAFTLGIAFAGWGPDNWFWPFGDAGAPLSDIPFAQVAARARTDGQRLALADFALAAVAAREERFAPASPDPRSPLSTLGPGITYPADALATRLATMAHAAGVQTGDAADADLHVEASGNAAEWESWHHWLPCNRVAARRVVSDRPPPPYPLHTATADGWRAHVALDGSLCETIHSVDGPGSPYTNGIRREPWRGTFVAIGAAAAVVEPVLGTALLQAHDDVARLIDLLPHDPANAKVEAAEYNRLTRARAEAIRDAAVALWATNARTGEPLWDAARDHAPPALAHRLALYRSRGHLSPAEHDPLSRAEWSYLLDGQGLRPRRLDPRAAAIPLAEATAHCARIRDRLTAAARTMPPHHHALARLRTS